MVTVVTFDNILTIVNMVAMFTIVTLDATATFITMTAMLINATR
jgi:hypothetical protein